MNNVQKKIELLAPAKNKECAFAAIDAGADAVYIGGMSFGARKNAANSIEDIEEIVKYAHKFLVKVYVTVNTLVLEKELNDVKKIIWDLYYIGADAIIFQDFSLLQADLPPIALHASTQCNNDDLAKIKFLKDCNVERVVLPREFSLAQIKDVIKNVDIQTEVFVHGALCVSYSGQCYFSNYIGGRSANRGECAQPCRKKYSLVDETGKCILEPAYLLSMKDNNLSQHISELIDAGVDSLKIEGRLKDKDYVTNVVSYYRKAIDEVSAFLSPAVGSISTDFISDVNKTFNRGYTNFYFDSQRKVFIDSRTPKFIGELLGKVNKIDNKRISISTNIKLNVSDKIVYFDSKNELNGTTVTKVNSNSIEVLNIGKIQAGTVLYRNYDSSFYKTLNTAKFVRKVPLSVSVSKDMINIKSFAQNEITYKFNENYEKAQNVVKAKETFIKQFSKLGDTEFFADKIEISEDFDLFIPISQINEIRRKAINQLQKISAKNYKYSRRNTDFGVAQYPVKNLNYSYNVANSKSKEFFEKCGSTVIEFAPECKKQIQDLCLMKTKHCLRDYAGICLKKCKNKHKLYLINAFKEKFPLEFDCQNCIMLIKEPQK